MACSSSFKSSLICLFPCRATNARYTWSSSLSLAASEPSLSRSVFCGGASNISLNASSISDSLIFALTKNSLKRAFTKSVFFFGHLRQLMMMLIDDGLSCTYRAKSACIIPLSKMRSLSFVEQSFCFMVAP